jgi:hypothetical protein
MSFPHHYAGIGSRKLTEDQRTLCERIGVYLAEKGYTLRTGACAGADQAFAAGALRRRGEVQYDVPWADYERDYLQRMVNEYPSQVTAFVLEDSDAAAYASVAVHHPAYEHLVRANKVDAIQLHARNWNIIFSRKAVDFVIALPTSQKSGTMQGVRIANASNIPVIRLDKLKPVKVRAALDDLLSKRRKIDRRVTKVIGALPNGYGMWKLGEAQSYMAEGMVDDGTHCPCCGRWAKVNGRPFNSTMARGLIWLARKAGRDRRWVDVPKEAPRWLVKSNQISITAHWGFVESKESADPKKKTTGLWRPTPRGVGFARGRIKVRQRVHTFNNRVVGWSGPEVDVEDALGTKFNYAEVMSMVMKDD